MKFYVPFNKLCHIKEYDVDYLEEVTIEYSSNKIYKDLWASGYILEADNTLQTFFLLKSGFILPDITNREYIQLCKKGTLLIEQSKIYNIRRFWSMFPSVVIL